VAVLSLEMMLGKSQETTEIGVKIETETTEVEIIGIEIGAGIGVEKVAGQVTTKM
jgi:hypothetical protein